MIIELFETITLVEPSMDYGIAPLALAAGLKIGSKIAGGIIGSGARKKEMREAKAGYDKQLSALESQDISNPYANEQNVYEDLTVNTQEADMLAGQQQQALGNTMQNLQGAAGGSGIAALAQSMANQQSQNLQQATVSIGQQESANQLTTMQEQGAMNSRQVEGEMYNRRAQAARTSGMLSRAGQRYEGAIKEKSRATGQLMGGIGEAVGLGSTFLPGGVNHRDEQD
tara:strand:- start:3494 stop:4174 length:681 start_codon:yes stop_codon:yes gene_type:complete